ncbi:MAG: thioredoxin fold domain-containing protein [Gammaproteobacteria bacterium]|nr:thioredoxin fold domain-containing protein [Gammaproteobacteria bacterium]MYF02997.1 thioredoxin fold domain-containing protein [Gammaproteobacteria bacterium]MYI76522.1 thioredoxin fold domain-containing protein [Gammaproteobacteria bacterium]
MNKKQQQIKTTVLISLMIVGLLFFGVTSSTQETTEANTTDAELEQKQETVRETVRRLGGKVQSIEETPVENFFLVETPASEFLYITGSGKHFFVGTLYEMRDDAQFPFNLTEESRNKSRSALLQALDKDESINFAADTTEGSESAVVYVFTDITCGYCRLLHKDMDDYNKAGIEIRYLAFPRAGVDSPSAQYLESAWCADDPNAAMTLLKNGKEIEQKSCENPVAEHHQLGLKMQVRGTPALILADGSLIPGYQKPAQLVQILEQLESSDS